MKLSPNGDQLRGSYTLNVGQSTKALALAIDPAGDIAVTGYTLNDAPMGTPGAYQAVSTNQCFYQPMSSLHLPYLNTDVFVMKLDPALTSPRFVSYLSGNCADQGNAIATDASGNVWVLGDSASFDFPTRALYQGAGFPNGFVSELSADGSQLLFSSGTDGLGMAFDPSGSLLLTGSQLTIAPTSWELIKIDPLTNPGAVIDQIQPVNYDTGTVTTAFNTIAGVAPGQLVRIKGSHLGPEVKVYAQTDSGSFPSSLADVTVSFDQVRAPIVSVQAGEIICVAPFEISQFTQISVFAGGQQSNQVRMSVVSAWPAIVSILNADGIPNSPDHPAQVGSTVWLYLSGLGPTLPPDTDGAVNATNVLPRANPSLFADGIQVGTIAAAPGQPAGVFRVSVTTPKPQNGSGKVSMILTISPNLSSVAANLYVGP
jgi:uncharacterized protein (TIGR03437 family)